MHTKGDLKYSKLKIFNEKNELKVYLLIVIADWKSF